MVWYAEQDNLLKPDRGTSGTNLFMENNPICVLTLSGFFIGDNMRQIPLTQGKFAIVDDCDYEWLIQWNWCAAKGKYCWYAMRGTNKNGKPKTIRMHRVILGLRDQDRLISDHKNHNGLDNRRSNLRSCLSKQNNQNSRPYKNGSSRYKGVCWVNRDKKWIATITVDRKQTCIGRFDNEIDAAKCYDKKAKKLFGGFACLNLL